MEGDIVDMGGNEFKYLTFTLGSNVKRANTYRSDSTPGNGLHGLVLLRSDLCTHHAPQSQTPIGSMEILSLKIKILIFEQQFRILVMAAATRDLWRAP